MAIVINTPDNFSGAFARVTFGIKGLEPASSTPVYINTGGSQFVKSVYGLNETTINVGAYLRDEMKMVPMAENRTAMSDRSSLLKTVSVSAGGTDSAQITVTEGMVNATAGHFLTERPLFSKISPPNSVELSFVTDGNAYTIIVEGVKNGNSFKEQIALTGKIAFFTVYINVADYISTGASAQDFSVVIQRNGIEYDRRDFQWRRVVVNSLRRVYWLNKFGAIDQYDFIAEEDTTLRTVKSKIYSSDGYRTTGSTAEKVINLRSWAENRATLDWLSEIVGSPRVWIGDGAGLEEVDVITDSIRIQGSGDGTIRISCREGKIKQFQHY